MQLTSPVAIVEEWQGAVNSQAIDRLLELSDPHIEIVGPRGSAFGHAVLRDWLSRAGLSLTPQRVFARDHVVVVAQHGVWRSVETGELIGEADVASVFRVMGPTVTYYARYDSLDEALAAGEVGLGDAV